VAKSITAQRDTDQQICTRNPAYSLRFFQGVRRRRP
jgi:hypothetical protein